MDKKEQTLSKHEWWIDLLSFFIFIGACLLLALLSNSFSSDIAKILFGGMIVAYIFLHKKIKNIFISLLSSIVIIIFIVTFSLLASIIDKGYCASIESQLQNIARESRKNLPIQIGEVQATNITAIGKTLLATYNFTKQKSLLGNLSDLKVYYYRSSRNTACSNPDTLKALKLGVSVVYEYYDVDNVFVMKFIIDQNSCR